MIEENDRFQNRKYDGDDEEILDDEIDEELEDLEWDFEENTD